MDEARASIDNASFRSKKRSKNGSNRYEQSSLASDENEFLKEYQNYSFRTIDESPQNLDKNRSATISLDNSPSSFKKKSMIEQLTEKNEMLRKEVERVEKILNMGERKKENKLLPYINDEALRQELSNAYKQIRIYENEVDQRKKLFDHEGSFVDKIRKSELTLLERQDMVKRIEAEISEAKKQSNELVKLLQDGHIQKEYANKSSRLHKEIKYYENMLKEEAALQLSDQDNVSKKRVMIKDMEQSLLSSGFSKVELTLIRKKYEANPQRTAPSQLAKSGVQEENRSPAAFNDLKNQINILKKMQKDYTKKIEQLEKQKSQAGERSKKSKQNLQQVEKELQMVEKQFQNLKKRIDPAKIKSSMKGGPNQSTFSQFAGQKSTNPLQHRFQVFQAGYHNKRSTIFNDRLIIGRKSAKIIQLTIFQNRTQFLGFQATYLTSDSQKKGGMNVLKRQNERFFKEKTVRLEQGDYFKTFQCAISKQNIITGIIAMSNQGKVVKAGFLEGMKMELEMIGKEYPCCMYGSYSQKGIEMLGVEKVEGE